MVTFVDQSTWIRQRLSCILCYTSLNDLGALRHVHLVSLSFAHQSLCPCSVHVTSVIQLMHMLMTRGRIIEADMVDELTLFACYMAAAVHDYGHGGVTNDFLNR